MAHAVTRSMLRRPVDEWPVTCGLTCPTGPLRLEQIGVLLGCSRERVRQIEEQAMARLVVAMRRRGVEREADIIATGDGV